MKYLAICVALLMISAVSLRGDRVLVDGGSVIAPSIAYKEAPNTGIFFPSTTQIRVSLFGTENIRWIAGQQYIFGGGDVILRLQPGTGVSDDANIWFGDSVDSNEGFIQYDKSADAFNFGMGGVTPNVNFSINDVGLGVVSGPTTATLRLDSNSATGASQIEMGDLEDDDIGRIVYNHNVSGGGRMSLFTNDTEMLRIDPTFVEVFVASTAGTTDMCSNSAAGGRGRIVECSSSKRFKKNIVPMSDRYTVDNLLPVEFDWKHNNRHDIGLAAEDIAAVYPELANYSTDGRPSSVNYRHAVVIPIAEIQRLKKREKSRDELIESLIERIEELEAR